MLNYTKNTKTLQNNFLYNISQKVSPSSIPETSGNLKETEGMLVFDEHWWLSGVKVSTDCDESWKPRRWKVYFELTKDTESLEIRICSISLLFFTFPACFMAYFLLIQALIVFFGKFGPFRMTIRLSGAFVSMRKVFLYSVFSSMISMQSIADQYYNWVLYFSAKHFLFLHFYLSIVC